MLNKTDKIYIGFVTCVIIFAVVGVVFVIKSNIQKLGAEKDLILVDIKLNEAKDKILQSKEVDWIIEKEDGTQENNGKIRSYDYITDKKVEDKIKFKPGKSYSNEKIISQVGATTTSALYIGDHFYKDTKGDVYEIEHGATTTIEQWNKQIETKILGASPDSYYTGAGDGAYSFYNSLKID